MDRGKLVGFHGLQVQHSRERPYGIAGIGIVEERLAYERLPRLAALAGLELVEVLPISQGVDPYVLYDRWGHIVYQWDEGVEPSWLDVLEVCNRLLNKHS